MGKLSTFVQSNNTILQTYATEYITATDKTRLFLLQELLGHVRNITGILAQYDIIEIDITEIDAKTSGNLYESIYDKDRSAVLKLQKQVELKLLNKDAEKSKNKLLALIQQLGSGG